MDDWQLINQYNSSGSQEAFSELVSRNINWIYSAALRQLRNPALAEDATQAVFVVLARRAKGLSPRISLAGWLFQTMRFACNDIVKSETRRRRYEQKAAAMHTELSSQEIDSAWAEISEHLESAVASLGKRDRDLILQRFYQSKPYGEIAASAGISEEAAKKRIARALVRLREFPKLKSAVAPAALDAVLIAKVASSAAPAGLVKIAAGAAITAKAASLTPLIQHTLSMLKWSALKIPATVAASVVIVAATAAPVVISKVSRPKAAAVVQAPVELPAIPTNQALDLPAPVQMQMNQIDWPSGRTVYMLRYMAAVDATGKSEIEKVAAVADADTRNCRVMTCDTDSFHKTLVSLQSSKHLKHLTNTTNADYIQAFGWSSGLGDAVPNTSNTKRDGYQTAVNYQINAFAYLNDLIGLRFNTTNLTINNGRTTIRAAVQYTGNVAIGKTLLVLTPTPTGELTQIIALDAIEVPSEMDNYYTQMPSAQLWITRGQAAIEQLGLQTQDWLTMARTAPELDAKWTQKLPGGSSVSLLGLVNPDDSLNPYCWFRPDGQPANIPVNMGVARVGSTKTRLIAMLQFNDPASPQPRYFNAPSNADDEYCHRTEQVTCHADGTVTIGIGDGPYTTIAQLPPTKGASASANGTTYKIDSTSGGQVSVRFDDSKDIDIRLIAVDKEKEIHYGQWQTPQIYNGTYRARKNFGINEIFYGDSNGQLLELNQIDHVEIQSRPRKFVTFSGFAKEPSVPLPPLPTTAPSK